MAIQLAEVCFSSDRTKPGESTWESATVDGEKFVLPSAENSVGKERKFRSPDSEIDEFDLPTAGILKVRKGGSVELGGREGGACSAFSFPSPALCRRAKCSECSLLEAQLELKQKSLPTMDNGETAVSDRVLEVPEPLGLLPLV